MRTETSKKPVLPAPNLLGAEFPELQDAARDGLSPCSSEDITGTLFNISMLSLSERSSNNFSDLSSRNGCASRPLLFFILSAVYTSSHSSNLELAVGKPKDRSAAKPRLAIMVKSHSRLHFFFFCLSYFYLLLVMCCGILCIFS